MDFKSKEIEHQYLEKISQIQRLIDAPVDNSKFLWDGLVKDYATKIAQVRSVLNDNLKDEANKGSQDVEDLSNELMNFLNRCASPEFQIALVGTIKAGKSTLINAFLNYELASTRVTPETAALTKFKHAAEDFVQISFYTPAEWAELWKSATSTSNNVFIKDYKKLNADAEKSKWLGHATQTVKCASKEALKAEIGRWTSSKSPCHYFVKEVVVGLRDFDLPKNVVLVDTPGLDDVVEFRSNITRAYIAQANAVLMCIKSDALNGGELQTLYRVFNNTNGKPEKVYVIATQIDNLNNPRTTWQEQQTEWTKYLEDTTCYGSAKLAQKNLVPVSAYLYTLLNEYRANRIGEEDARHYDLLSILPKFRILERDLNTRFDELKEFTNISFLYDKLQHEVIDNASTELLDDIKRSYEHCRKSINKVLGKIKSEQKKIIDDSRRSIDEIRRERDNKHKELEKIRSDKKELDDFVNQLKAETSRRIDEVVRSIKNGARMVN